MSRIGLFSVTIFVLDTVFSLPYECSPGKWGSQCTYSCGNCEGGHIFCHVHDGRCLNGCAAGYTGLKCKTECPVGTHGQYCKEKCGLCGKEAPICNRQTGECPGACKSGYQPPFCKMACAYKTWGKNCEKVCDCSDLYYCGCHPVKGSCLTCNVHQEPFNLIFPDPIARCINPFDVKNVDRKYKNKNTVDIPWIPILSFLGAIGTFVIVNFVHWYFFVRRPADKRKETRINRDIKPELHKLDTWFDVWRQIQESKKATKEKNLGMFQYGLKDPLLSAQLEQQHDLIKKEVRILIKALGPKSDMMIKRKLANYSRTSPRLDSIVIFARGGTARRD